MPRTTLLFQCLIAALALACGPAASNEMDPNPMRTKDRVPPPAPTSDLVRTVPTDTRPATRSALAARPIVGGTLLVTHDGAWAVASDSERDNISFVDLKTRQLVAQLALSAGDEPFRGVEDDHQYVHIVLRGAGEVATVDPSTQKLLFRRKVCAAPRGIAFDASAHALRVACDGGEIIALGTQEADVPSTLAKLEPGLRDVIASPSGLFASRFKRASLVKLDASGKVAPEEQVPTDVRTTFSERSGALVLGDLQADMAWRTVAATNLRFLMLHQGAATQEIDIAPPSEDEPAPVTSAYGGGSLGSAQCQGVVQTELSLFDSGGTPLSTARIGAVLAVDVAVDDAGNVAVAQAGVQDNMQPAVTVTDKNGSNPTPSLIHDTPGVLLFSVDGVTPESLDGTHPCLSANVMLTDGMQIVSVAFGHSDDANNPMVIAQSREPAALVISTPQMVPLGDSFGAPPPVVPTIIALGTDNSVYDTGHELFHRDAGAGIACASCHGEGAEDGHVWTFTGQGKRRTQALHVGLAGTAPFHWDGELQDVGHLMEDVFVARMGGVHESTERVGALEDFLFSLSAPAQLRASDDAAAIRGKAIFEGDGTCSTCHSGAKLTNNKTVDVGTGKALQVPSLIGVAYRTPLMHDGCAKTLRDRFNPECGGKLHGKTAQLTSEQLDDLIAYVESL